MYRRERSVQSLYCVLTVLVLVRIVNNNTGRGSVPRYATRFFSRYDTYRTDRIDPSVCLATIPKYRIERSLRFGIFRYSVRTYNNTLRTIRNCTCREVTYNTTVRTSDSEKLTQLEVNFSESEVRIVPPYVITREQRTENNYGTYRYIP